MLVKPVPKTSEEIELFEATERQDVEGEVVLSPDSRIGKGSIVIFNKYAGHEVDIDGVKHKILYFCDGIDSEVLAVKTLVAASTINSRKKGVKHG